MDEDMLTAVYAVVRADRERRKKVRPDTSHGLLERYSFPPAALDAAREAVGSPIEGFSSLPGGIEL